MNHSFLHARLKQPRRLLGHNGLAEIRALPLAAPVALKEVELRRLDLSGILCFGTFDDRGQEIPASEA
jgi:hypothetical protein